MCKSWKKVEEPDWEWQCGAKNKRERRGGLGEFREIKHEALSPTAAAENVPGFLTHLNSKQHHVERRLKMKKGKFNFNNFLFIQTHTWELDIWRSRWCQTSSCWLNDYERLCLPFIVPHNIDYIYKVIRVCSIQLQWLRWKFVSFNPLFVNETQKHYAANVTDKRSYPYFAVCTRLSQFWINWAILLHFAFPGPIWQTCNIFIATLAIWILTQSPVRPCLTLLQNILKTNALQNPLILLPF